MPATALVVWLLAAASAASGAELGTPKTPDAASDPPAAETPGGSCSSPAATEAFQAGFRAQREIRSGDAAAHYARCLEIDPSCIACLYEKGWSHWSRSEWGLAEAAWGRVLALDPAHEGARTWLPHARDQGSPEKTAAAKRVPIGTRSSPRDAPVTLVLEARFQNYDAHPKSPKDHYDQDVSSPKSARFSRDGSKVWVNSLEGMRTVVYDTRTLAKVRAIAHDFGPEDAPLFRDEETVFGYTYYRYSPSGRANDFRGRPVESALSHAGRYLWVPYYRRDYDRGATSPSAVAVVDAMNDEIVRVLPTGPIPKYVAISPDDRWAAIVHWGDNTVGLVDISSGEPASFRYAEERLVVEQALPQRGLAGQNRDDACGYCLRGTVFTPDGRTLLVARMGGGGIAGFDVESRRYLGTAVGMKPTPRHLILSPDGRTLYFSSNVSGYVSRIGLGALVEALSAADGRRVAVPGLREVYLGGGARTIEASPDGRWIFAAVNTTSELVVVDAEAMDVVARVRTDPYTVGLAVSPEGRQVWTTSQGKKGKGGGNSVCVYRATTNAP